MACEKSWFITDGFFLLCYQERKVYLQNSWTSKKKHLRNKFKMLTKTCWQKCWTACSLVSTGWFNVKETSFDSKDFNQVSLTFFRREIEKEEKKKEKWRYERRRSSRKRDRKRERKWEPPVFWTTCQPVYYLNTES